MPSVWRILILLLLDGLSFDYEGVRRHFFNERHYAKTRTSSYSTCIVLINICSQCTTPSFPSYPFEVLRHKHLENEAIFTTPSDGFVPLRLGNLGKTDVIRTARFYNDSRRVLLTNTQISRLIPVAKRMAALMRTHGTKCTQARSKRRGVRRTQGARKEPGVSAKKTSEGYPLYSSNIVRNTPVLNSEIRKIFRLKNISVRHRDSREALYYNV
jgi:hypothetical protein